MSKETETSSDNRPGNASLADVGRSAFLSINFPNHPYYSFKRGPSTHWNESFHIRKDEKQLNVYWRHDGLITASLFDGAKKNPWGKYKHVYSSKKFSSEIANDLCARFLS